MTELIDRLIKVLPARLKLRQTGKTTVDMERQSVITPARVSEDVSNG